MKITRTWLTLVLMSLALVSACGKKNESGSSSSSSKYFGALGSYEGVAPANVSNPYVSRVFQMTQCTTGGGYLPNGNYNPNLRVGHGQQMSFRVSSNSSYVGVTAEGDVAVLTGDANGRAVLSLYVCPRPTGGQGVPTPTGNFTWNVTYQSCRVDQITALTAFIPGGAGFPNLALVFFPIHFNPTLRQELCAQ